jgi:hypothetical protein
MVFILGTNAPDAIASNSDPTRVAIGSSFTFPAISVADAPLAPEKTGILAQPLIVSLIEMAISSTDGDRLGSLALWNANGARVAESATFTLPDTGSPTTQVQNISFSQAIFPGRDYVIGFIKYSTGTYYWAGVSDSTKQVRASTLRDFFNNAGAVGFAGVIDHLIVCYTLPSQPLSLVATSSDYDIELTWDEVADDGGAPVTGYVIQRSTNGINWTTINANSNSTTRVYNDDNLTPGFTYYYRIAALNLVALRAGANYWGPYSEVATTPVFAANAGNAQSLLTATVSNPDPIPLEFTDTGSGIPFTDISVQYGSEYLYTQVEATTQDSFAELQLAEAPESKELYGVRTYSITNLLNSDDLGAFEVAKDFLTYYYQPELRVDAITIRLENLTLEERLQVLALEIDSYISVSFTPNGIGDPKTTSGLVTAIANRITLTSHEVELRLRNERTLFTLDSNSRGILNVNTLGP